MATPARTARSLNREHLSRQRSVERRLRTLHLQASDRIERATARIGFDTPARVERLQTAIDREMERLARRAEAIMQRHMASEVRFGLRSAEVQSRDVDIPQGGTRMVRGNQRQRAITNGVGRLRASEGISFTRRLRLSYQGMAAQLNRFISMASEGARTLRQAIPDIRSFFVLHRPNSRRQKRLQRQLPGFRGQHRSALGNTIRTFRSESNRAYRIGVQQYARTKRWVRAVQWHLSAAHPEDDVCDGVATADLFGLGPGVYPPDAVPDVPHIRCMCFTSIVTREMLN